MEAGSSKFRGAFTKLQAAARRRRRHSRVRGQRLSLRVTNADRRAAQLFPLLARDAPERRDHARVELPPAERLKLGNRSLVAAPGPVDAVARHRVEGVGHGEDSRVDVNLLATKSQRIARPVPLLVVLRDDARSALQKFDAAQNLRAVQRILAHPRPLVLRERGGLPEYRVGPSDLADVVEERAE